ncbi:MAG TPA: hypothetical protein VGQ65_18495 [Thermoanaerobaculia bacterium]|nr:hypothetical protein [Thermoanaerobaculia bacterium]
MRAVGSALSAGANLQEFKKYQIESQIKVDALPNTPENKDIRAVSDLYREAVTFGVMSVTDGKIAANELSAAKELHRLDGNDPDRKERAMYDKAISEALTDMTPEEAMGSTADAEAEAATIRSHAIQTRADVERLATLARAAVNQEYRYKANVRSAKEISQVLLLEAKYATQKLK